MADQFCLRWNNFQTNIVNALDSLKCSEDLVDVTLTCEGKNIKAHKVILSACSPYFRSVFKENPCQHPVIILKDVLAEDIVNLLSYMYQGEVFIEESKLTSFLHTAALLQVKGLSGVTQQKEHFTSPNVSNKLFTQLTISSKSQFASHKETKVPTIKKRRCSTSDKPTEVTIEGNQKKTKYESCDIYNLPHLSKVVDSQIGVAETSAVKEAKSEHLPVVTNGKSASVAVKTGTPQQTNSPVESVQAVKVECREETDSPKPASESSENESLPDYENSMLARSLMTGKNPLKSDACANPSKKTPKEPPRSKDTTDPPAAPAAPAIAPPADELVIKSERDSPKPDVDYEPEVLLAEQQDSEAAYSQDSQMMFAGMAVPSTSANPWNNSAICGDCPHCGMKYSNQSALKYHVRLMHSDLTNRLCCYLCPRSFTMRETFKEHMWNTHGHRN